MNAAAVNAVLDQITAMDAAGAVMIPFGSRRGLARIVKGSLLDHLTLNRANPNLA